MIIASEVENMIKLVVIVPVIGSCVVTVFVTEGTGDAKAISVGAIVVVALEVPAL